MGQRLPHRPLLQKHKVLLSTFVFALLFSQLILIQSKKLASDFTLGFKYRNYATSGCNTTMVNSRDHSPSLHVVTLVTAPRRLTSSGNTLRWVRFDSQLLPTALALSCLFSPSGASLDLLVPSLSSPLTASSNTRHIV